MGYESGIKNKRDSDDKMNIDVAIKNLRELYF